MYISYLIYHVDGIREEKILKSLLFAFFFTESCIWYMKMSFCHFKTPVDAI